MDKLAAVLLVSLAVIIMLALNLFFSLFHMYMIKKRYESQPRLLNVLYFLLAISIQVRLGWGRTVTNRFHNRFSQSLGPSPGWKRLRRLLALSHLRHY